MRPKLIQLTQRFNDWRLILIIILASVAMAEMLVALLHWWLEGFVPTMSLWVGLITGLIVASVVTTLVTYLLNELAETQASILQEGMSHAKHNLNLAIESARMIFWELDLVTGKLRYDDTLQNWLHINIEQAAHTIPTWLARIHPDDQAPFMAMFQRVLAEDSEFDFEYRMMGSDLNWVWIQTRGRVVQRNADGKALLAAGGSLNIQARKNAELALRETKERLQIIFNDNPDIMLISRLSDGYITDVNDAFVRASGYSKTEAIGQTTLSLKLWAEGFDRERMIRELKEQGYCQHLEAIFQGRGQPPIMGALVAVITVLDGIPHILSTVRDISAAKQLEEGLRRTKERYDFATQVGHVGTWDWNPLTDVLFWSDETYRLMGYTPGQVIPTYALYLGLLHPDDREMLNQAVQAALHQHKPYALDCRIVLGDAHEIACHVTGKVEFDANDQPTRMLGTIQDISVRKQMETALIESRNLLKTIIDTSPMRVFWKDRDSRYLGCNPVFANDAGQANPQEIIGKTDFDMTWRTQAELYRADDKQVMDSGIAKLSYDEPQSTPQGDTIWLRTSKTPLHDTLGNTIGILGIYEDITVEKQAEQALQASEARAQSLYTLLRLITDNVPDMIWAKDLQKRFIFANQAICRQLLNARDTDEPVGKDDMFFALRERNAHPDDPHWHNFGELCQDSDTITLQNGKPSQFDEYGNVQGKFLFLDVRKAPLLNHAGEVIGVVGAARDVTEQKADEEKLRLAALVLQNSSEALIVTDEKNHIVGVNPAFTQLTGYSLDEVVGQDPALLHSDRHDEAFYRNMWADINTTGRWQGEMWNRRKNGEIYAEWLTINTIYNEDGTVHRRVAMFSDITEKKKNEEIIWTHANFDPLTQLPNRRMFYDRLAQDMKKAHRAGLKLALLFLDLDRFKEVNDTLGHEVGDSLLVQAAQRIAACVRESDTVARLGGDEFTIILADLDELSCVERIAECILHTLNQPFELGNDLAYVSASIGITLYPDDATTLETMLTNADQAMYVAKNSGRNRFSYFTNAMQQASQHRLHLLNDLRGAVAGEQLQLYYQPIVTLATGDIHKAEALIRWFHPQRGLINPAEFIPLAEDSGLIHEIGDWVFKQAAQQALQWQNRYPTPIQISINKSPVQFQDNPNHCHWHEHLQAIGLSGEHIVIEITEGLLLKNSPEVAAQLLAFRDAGIQVSIDDFGTGYSALSYLKKLDIDYVKIDQSFIRNLVTDASDRALTEAIVVMAHKLGLKVIAEGVETVAQRDLLRQIGCDYAQGYLYSRPIPAKDFEALLA